MVCLVSLGVILTYSLQFSRVQTFFAQKAATYLSNKLDAEINIEKIYFKPFSSILIQNFSIVGPNDQTIVEAQELKARMDLKRLLYGQLLINKIDSRGARFLYHLDKDGNSNIDFLVDYFFQEGSQDGPKTKNTIKIRLEELQLQDNEFHLINDRYTHHANKVDFSNLHLRNLSGSLKNLELKEDSYSGKVENLQFDELSGFSVTTFNSTFHADATSMEFNELLIETPLSRYQDYFRFDFDDFKDFSDFIAKVHMTTEIQDSYIDSRDIAYFAPDLWKINFFANIQTASAEGTVDNLQARHLAMEFAENSAIEGSLSIIGLPDIHNTLFTASIQRANTQAEYVEDFVSKILDNKPFTLPEQLHHLGAIDFSGEYLGQYHNFDLKIAGNTELGSLNLESKIDIIDTISYQGQLMLEEFALGEFIPSESLGEVNADLHFQGAGLLFDKLALESEGYLLSSVINKHRFDSIYFHSSINDASIDLLASVSDSSARLKVNSSFKIENNALAHSQGAADITYANLQTLGVFKNKQTEVHGSTLNWDLYGNNFSSLTGDIYGDSLTIETPNHTLSTQGLSLEFIGLGDEKAILFNSPLADVSLYGTIDPQSIVSYFRALAMHYAPSIGFETQHYGDQNFQLEAYVKEADPLLPFIQQDLKVSDDTRLIADFSSDNMQASFELYSPELSYKGIKLSELRVSELADGDAFKVQAEADRLSFSDSTYINHVAVNSIIANDILDFDIIASQAASKNYLNLDGKVFFENKQPAIVSISNSAIVLNNKNWELRNTQDLLISKGRVIIPDLILSQENQLINLSGVLSNQPSDKLKVDFQNFSLSSLSGITTPLGFNLQGDLRGELDISSAFDSPFLQAELTTSPILYNEQPIGKLDLKAYLLSESKRAQISSKLINEQQKGFILNGYYHLENKENPLELTLDLQKAPLTILQPFLKELVSDLEGEASAKLTVRGGLNKPIFEGNLEVEQSQFLVNYLKTKYQISNQYAFINNNSILLDNFKFEDHKNSNANARGIVDLSKLTDPYIDIDIQAQNFQFLNTEWKDNRLYHGKIYASGTMKFKGEVSAMNIQINASSDPGTSISIPLNTSMSVEDNEFIYFVGKEEDNSDSTRSSLDGLTMSMELSLDQDAEVSIQTDLGTLKGNGEGEISMLISSLGDFEMFGDYIVNQGQFHFTSQDFFNKYFDLQQGGTIRWTGNPEEANINLTAIYQQRTSVAPLYNAAGRSSNEERVLAQADMNLKGKLIQPDISFDLNFPQEPYIKDELQGFLSDMNNVNQQALSLIVRRSFTPATTSEFGREVNNTLISAGTEIAFNQLNVILAQSLNLDFFDINIRSFNDASASFRFFDDRLVLSGGITDRRNLQLTDLAFFSDRVATDAELTYKLLKDGSLLFRANNRLNTRNFLLNPQDEYVSAIGLVYRQDFDRIQELWRKLWTRKKKNKDQNKDTEK